MRYSMVQNDKPGFRSEIRTLCVKFGAALGPFYDSVVNSWRKPIAAQLAKMVQAGKHDEAYTESIHARLLWSALGVRRSRRVGQLESRRHYSVNGRPHERTANAIGWFRRVQEPSRDTDRVGGKADGRTSK